MTAVAEAPEATAQALRNGWLYTGDLGYLDEDGYLYFVDRVKDMVRRGDENISSEEVERVLNSHPAVLNSAVVGRSIEGNEEIIAFVEPTPGSTIEVAELLALVERQLAPYKKPQQIIVLPQLPVAPNGKIRKHDLKKRAEESLSAATSV